MSVPWKERLAASGAKLKEATSNAGTSMRSGMSSFSGNWKEKYKPSIAAKLAAAGEAIKEGGTKLSRGLSDTGGKMGQNMRQGVLASRSLMQRLDWRQQVGASGKGAFGVALEQLLQKPGATADSVPKAVTQCTEYLTASGLQTEGMFRTPGKPDVMRKLVRLYDTDPAAPLPVGTDVLDVAALLKLFFQLLPEPVLSYDLYEELLLLGGSDVDRIRGLIATGLPLTNAATLKCLCGLLRKISSLSAVNKLSAHDLASEMAPVLGWPRPPVVLDSPSRTFSFRRATSSPATSPSPSKHTSPRGSNGLDLQISAEAEVLTLNDDAPAVLTPTHIPLDDASPEEHAIRAAVQCMIERCEDIFEGINGQE